MTILIVNIHQEKQTPVSSTYEMHPVPADDARWSVDLGGVHVVFGDGTLDRLGEEVRRLGIGRVLLVTDPGLEEVGHPERALESLQRAGVETRIFDGVEENPTTENVASGVDAAREHCADGLIGLGGGSPMDCAKGINFIYTNGGKVEDYWGAEKAKRPMLPSVGVPTTTGTGSDAQRYALISQAETHAKMACGDLKARFRTVILDPELAASMPRKLAAVTGMDAISHAVESYVTRRRNPISQLYAREAWRLLESSFEPFLECRTDAGPRSRMLLGAHLAGAAIEASMLGAAHSCANPLTAHYGVIHGVAVGLMLPHVIRFNAAEVEGLYQELNVASGKNGHRTAGSESERLSARVAELYAATGLSPRLRDFGVEVAKIGVLADEASTQWTARFNPREVASSDLVGLYESAF